MMDMRLQISNLSTALVASQGHYKNEMATWGAKKPQGTWFNNPLDHVNDFLLSFSRQSVSPASNIVLGSSE